jgi:hypothetical protein
MTPTSQIPNKREHSSTRKQVPKGDTGMGKIVTTAAAIVVLTASWVCAGSFQGLADAASVRPLTPLYIQPGTVTKVEFKSNLKANSDMEMESDIPVAEPVAASSGPNIKPRPAVAFRERPSAAMAPPPRTNAGVDSEVGSMAENRDDTSSLESDLEKDLVLSPPPAKTEENGQSEPKPVIERKPVEQKSGVSGIRTEKKKAAPQVKKAIPPEQAQFATKSGKPIRKVHPLSQNQWNVPAGSNDPRYGRPGTPRINHAARSRNIRTATREPMDGQYRHPRQGEAVPERDYMTSEPRRAIVPPPTADRFVREGVTIKLAPAGAAPPYPDEYRDDSSGSDILSAATEIIGLPFAFISSLF